jgi:hypothetical protein
MMNLHPDPPGEEDWLTLDDGSGAIHPPTEVNLPVPSGDRDWGSQPISAGPPVRDRIVILGRRRAGKTIFLARLYEALWNGCTLADGKTVPRSERREGATLSRLSCRALTGAADSTFMRIIADLKAGRWPAATVGSTYAELEVSHNGRTHVVTTLDYPGEVFRKAFMLDSDEPDAVELRASIDRAAAAILLIDPSVVTAGGEEAREDTFGMTQVAMRIRRSASGENVPIAVVFTKCDQNQAFLKESGGTLDFTKRHFGQLFKGVQRTRVYPCAAVRVQTNSMGKSVPVIKKSPINVVEPLLYCIQQIEVGQTIREQDDQRRQVEREFEEQLRVEEQEKVRAVKSWTLFWVAVALLATVAVVGALLYVRK